MAGVTLLESNELFSHGADIGVRGRGATMDRAFEQAALALTSVMVDPARIEAVTTRAFSCRAPNAEILLYDWLNALVYALSADRLIFREFKVRIRGFALSAEAIGERIDLARHHPAVEVKGATFTELSVRFEQGLWTAQCVVDV